MLSKRMTVVVTSTVPMASSVIAKPYPCATALAPQRHERRVPERTHTPKPPSDESHTARTDERYQYFPPWPVATPPVVICSESAKIIFVTT